MPDTLDREDQIRRDLVAGVAHELRTPIPVLQAGHEALQDGVTEPTPAELSSLRDEVLRLARMVDDLQTLAAADAASLHLARSRSYLAGIATDSLARRFEAADVALHRRPNSPKRCATRSAAVSPRIRTISRPGCDTAVSRDQPGG